MRVAVLGDKPAIPAQHPAVGWVLSAQREPGFQSATGRTSVVCAALSTSAPQGVAVSAAVTGWIVSQLGLLS